MFLLDSSAVISILNEKNISFEKLIISCTCPPILQEVLQGIKNDDSYEIIKNGLLSLKCFGDPISKLDFIQAATIYRFSRKQGITIRSSIDCLIALIAKNYKLTIVHKDRDFVNLSKIIDIKEISLEKFLSLS